MPNSVNLLSPREIKILARKHGAGIFNVRDEALIACAGMAYFTLTDLSLIKVADLISESSGNIKNEGYLPAKYNASGKSKYFYIGVKTYLRKTLDQYLKWRLGNKFGLLDLGLWAGMDPESRFFLRDDGKPFELTFRQRHEGDTLTQPTQLKRHFQKFYLGEGFSYRALNDSFIYNFWKTKSPLGSAQAKRDLIEMTGLTPATLQTKCIRDQATLQETLETLYR